MRFIGANKNKGKKIPMPVLDRDARQAVYREYQKRKLWRRVETISIGAIAGAIGWILTAVFLGDL